jgi:type I restriction enzyme M protein
MISRKNKMLGDKALDQISDTYHSWRNLDGEYEDVAGFCKSATLEEVEANNFVLTPGRYVGAEDIEDDGIPFDEKVATITSELSIQFAKSNELQERIKLNLGKIGIEL